MMSDLKYLCICIETYSTWLSLDFRWQLDMISDLKYICICIETYSGDFYGSMVLTLICGEFLILFNFFYFSWFLRYFWDIVFNSSMVTSSTKETNQHQLNSCSRESSVLTMGCQTVSRENSPRMDISPGLWRESDVRKNHHAWLFSRG